jgi:hypothetical protein
MRRPIVAGPASRPSLLGLLVGGAVSVALGAVVLGTAAVAQTDQITPPPILEATHLPPLLVVPGEKVKLAFDVHCANAGVDDPERPCAVTGSLFVRRGSSGPFQAEPLAAEDAGGLRRLTAAVPDVLTDSPDGFEYYTELEVSGFGGRLRVPSGPAATYQSYLVPNAIEARLAPRPFESTRRGSRVAEAPWGDGPRDVGLESGRSADPIGASSFDVDTSGAVVVLDEAHRRALRWRAGAREPRSIPLSVEERIADLAVAADSSMYVLESVAAPGHRPLVRHFDPSGHQLRVVETAELSPSEVRLGPDGPVVLQHPSHLWMPVASGDDPLSPSEQLRRGRVGRPTRLGSEVVVLRSGNELRLALLAHSRVQVSWRLVSSTALGEVQLAEPLGDRLAVVVRAYNGAADEFRVILLDRRGIVHQFSVESADWAETAPLSRFRLVGGSLYQLGSDPSGAFVDRYDLEVR